MTLRQPWRARMSAAYISFIRAFSPKACGITLVQRCALPTARTSAHLPTACHHDHQGLLRRELKALQMEDTGRQRDSSAQWGFYA